MNLLGANFQAWDFSSRKAYQDCTIATRARISGLCSTALWYRWMFSRTSSAEVTVTGFTGQPLLLSIHSLHVIHEDNGVNLGDDTGIQIDYRRIHWRLEARARNSTKAICPIFCLSCSPRKFPRACRRVRPRT